MYYLCGIALSVSSVLFVKFSGLALFCDSAHASLSIPQNSRRKSICLCLSLELPHRATTNVFCGETES